MTDFLNIFLPALLVGALGSVIWVMASTILGQLKAWMND